MAQIYTRYTTALATAYVPTYGRARQLPASCLLSPTFERPAVAVVYERGMDGWAATRWIELPDVSGADRR